jgi:2-keto-4-pentenoate hydratase/2-oxohepta-3-ene-1,7-dioic acid hydratase in catechol pathway
VTGAAPAHWVRFIDAGRIRFGTLERGGVRVCEGEMFSAAVPTERILALSQVQLLAPVAPGKIIALWNNFHALGAKLGLADPAEPLYLIKANGSLLAPDGVIRAPADAGKVVFEGELAVVIGRRCTRVPESQALDHVFGYTCANDVTLAQLLHRDPSFPQWTRAKGCDTFCPLGPAIATGLDPAQLVVRTLLDGELRQDYPIADMRFSVPQLVSRISHDMTLEAGDVILCGTSVGVGAMRPGSTVEVEIAGIGRLSNRFDQLLELS